MLADVVARINRGDMVGWTSPGFAAAMERYLTPELIAAVEHGRAVASERRIDLYDGEFFTGRQSVTKAKLLRASIVGTDADRTTVAAVIGTSEDATPIRTGSPYIYVFRLMGGSWKIDDFRIDPHLPTVKDTFLHPEAPIAR